MVRLRPLRNRGRPDLWTSVLSKRGAHGRDGRDVWDICRRLYRKTVRRPGRRILRRQVGPKGDPRIDSHDDEFRDGFHRLPTKLRSSRSLGARFVDRVAVASGVCRRGRMGRRRPHGGRVCSSRTTRILGVVSPDLAIGGPFCWGGGGFLGCGLFRGGPPSLLGVGPTPPPHPSSLPRRAVYHTPKK